MSNPDASAAGPPPTISTEPPAVGCRAIVLRLVAELRKEEMTNLMRARKTGSFVPAYFHASVICASLADVLERTLPENAPAQAAPTTTSTNSNDDKS